MTIDPLDAASGLEEYVRVAGDVGVNEIEVGFASSKAGARQLAAELGGLVKRVPDRRGWIVVRFDDPQQEVDGGGDGVIEPGIDGRVTDRNGWTWRHLVDAWYCERDEDGTWVDVSYTWRELVAVFGPVSSVEDAT